MVNKMKTINDEIMMMQLKLERIKTTGLVKARHLDDAVNSLGAVLEEITDRYDGWINEERHGDR